jgi:hypothetical protein
MQTMRRSREKRSGMTVPEAKEAPRRRNTKLKRIHAQYAR